MAKILLVEDDNNLREIYEARLQAEGYDIVSANDGEAALVVAKNEKPDLIISDVMMPKISGFEMLDILRNTQGLEAVKVIMLTALGQADDQARANKLGADRYLVKSQVTLEDIVKVSHELLEGETPAASPTPDATAPVSEPVAVTPAPPPQAPPTVQSIPVSSPPADDVAVVPTAVDVPAVPLPEPEPAAPAVPKAETEPTVETTPSTETAPASPAISDTPTTSSEETAVQEQIENFISSQPAEPPAAAEPQPDESTPAPEATTPETPAPAEAAPAASTTDNAADQAVLADAVDAIVANGNSEATGGNATSPQITADPPAERLAPPVEQEEEVTPGNVPIAHKKVIKPLDSQPGKSLDELLATEEANTPPPPPQPVLGDVSAPAPAIEEDQPAGAPAPPPHVAGTIIDPEGNHIDPNNIAL